MSVNVEPSRLAVPDEPPLERIAERLTFSDASDLLDALESKGIMPNSVEIGSDGTLTVKWSPRA